VPPPDLKRDKEIANRDLIAARCHPTFEATLAPILRYHPHRISTP